MNHLFPVTILKGGSAPLLQYMALNALLIFVYAAATCLAVKVVL